MKTITLLSSPNHSTWQESQKKPRPSRQSSRSRYPILDQTLPMPQVLFARLFTVHVMTSQASDRDTGNHSALQYRLVLPTTTEGKDSFMIEPYTGVIKSAIVYRNMRRAYFKFEVVATDDHGRGLSGSTEVVVRESDRNSTINRTLRVTLRSPTGTR